MSSRLTGVWRAIAVVVLLAACALPGLSQNWRSRAPRQPVQRMPPLPAPRGLTAASAVRPPVLPPGAPAGSPATSAPPSKPLEVVQGQGGQKLVSMEFYGLDIDHLLKLLSDAAGVTIVKSDQVTGPVTVIAPKPVPLDVAFQILNSVLAVRNFTMVREATGIWKVIPLPEALQSGNIPVNFGANPEDVPDTSQLITQVIPLEHLNAADVGNQIRGVLANFAVVTPTSTNSLIITDTAADINRALTIIANMEDQLSGGLKPIHLQYYDASGMADIINALILNKSGTTGGVAAGQPRLPYQNRLTPGPVGQPMRPGMPQAGAGVSGGAEFVYPDTRTNTLIVQATPEHFEQIENLVDSLDKPISLKNSIVIYPVQNMAASDLANLIGTQLNIKPNVVQTTAASGTSRPGTTPGLGGGLGSLGSRGGFGGMGYGGGLTGRTFGIMGSQVPSAELNPTSASKPTSVEVEPLAAPLKIAQAGGDAGMGGIPVPALPPVPTPLPPTGPGGEPVSGGGQMYGPSSSNVTEAITADNNTNTLVVTASPERLALIKEMLQELDVVPPQVYIQVIIAEVDVTKENDLGFQLNHILTQITHTRGGGRSPLVYNGTFGDNFNLGGFDATSGLGVAGGLTGVITGPNGFGLIVNALGSDSHARILSTPSIFTANNQTGSITVATSVPIPQQAVTSETGTGTGVTPVITQTVNYQPVGIVLNVLPRVTHGDFVEMDVQVQANDIGQPVNVAGLSYPTILNREADASGINLKDGYTVCLGGLMRDNVTQSKSKVPILGDLPIVGSLFRSSTDHVEKSELLVFLTPHIVRTADEAAQLTDQQKKQMQALPKILQTPSNPNAIVDPKKQR